MTYEEYKLKQLEKELSEKGQRNGRKKRFDLFLIIFCSVFVGYLIGYGVGHS